MRLPHTAKYERAAILYGGASALAKHAHLVLDPDLNRVCDWDMAGLRRHMGDGTFAEKFETGARLSRSEVVDLALE